MVWQLARIGYDPLPKSRQPLVGAHHIQIFSTQWLRLRAIARPYRVRDDLMLYV